MYSDALNPKDPEPEGQSRQSQEAVADCVWSLSDLQPDIRFRVLQIERVIGSMSDKGQTPFANFLGNTCIRNAAITVPTRYSRDLKG